jgi:phosphoenolpyruvate carboxykinase (GTP)
MPAYADLTWDGLDFDVGRFAQVTAIRQDEWTRELAAHDALFEKVGQRWPAALAAERTRLGRGLQKV